MIFTTVIREKSTMRYESKRPRLGLSNHRLEQDLSLQNSCFVWFCFPLSLLCHTFLRLCLSCLEKRLACSELFFCFVWSFMCLALSPSVCYVSCFVWVCCVSLFSSFGSLVHFTCLALLSLFYYVLVCFGLLLVCFFLID